MHPSYSMHSQDWEMIKTVLEGERSVKDKGEELLPYPVANVDRTTTEFTDIYKTYLEGAHFVNFSSEAQSDLVSAAFRVDPIYTPVIQENSGLSYTDPTQAARDAMSLTVAYGRCFLLVDFPSPNQEQTTNPDGSPIPAHPYILSYHPLDILDWATTEYSGNQTLTYVLLQEEKPRNPLLSETTEYQYRTLLIEDGIYKVRISEEPNSDTYDEVIPTNFFGKPFTTIPGTFIGSTNNLPTVDQSPILGIVNSNIAHYRTWAELTSTTVYLGSPALVLSGLPPGWVKSQKNNDNKITVGANSALALEGETSKASLLEINSDLTHYKTLDLLERSAQEQGYNLKSAMNKAGVESASAVMLRQSSQMSKLGAIVGNVESAMNLVLRYCSLYTNEPTTVVTLNRNFFPTEACEMPVNPGELPQTQTQQQPQSQPAQPMYRPM